MGYNGTDKAFVYREQAAKTGDICFRAGQAAGDAVLRKDFMKLIHISDLHLGKRFNEFPMLADQKYILKQILAIAGQEQADGVIIAGDIYDKPVPPAEAVQVFDGFLTELANQGRKVFAVSGNHDSAERLAFGGQLMRERGVYLSPVYDGSVTRIALSDLFGELFVYLLPFIRPAMVRHAMGDELSQGQPDSYQEAVRLALGRLEIDRTKRNVLVAHQFVAGAARCESEEITVGGIDHVDAELFDPFDYVALGHIHSPQTVGRETVRYCGTPLKYSFSEAAQQKSVSVVEFGKKGDIRIRTVLLKPLHDVREIRGSYLEVTERSFYQGSDTEDYVQITLTDEEDIPDGMQKLRIIYPNLMRLQYDNVRTRANQRIEVPEDMEKKSELELFEDFYKLQNNQPMKEEQEEYVKQLLRAIREE